MKTVGIDLGTTNSVIAIADEVEALDEHHQYGQVYVLPDEFKRDTLPSVVAYGLDDNSQWGLIAGYEALEIVKPPPARFAKRVLDTDIRFPLGDKQLTPTEVQGEVLKKLVSIGERYLGPGNVKDIVVTVPAYFQNAQRVLTAKSAELAGLRVKKILLEPTAAALAYDHLNPKETSRIMVYDLGGGTFDITLLEKKEGAYRVLQYGGDRELGGFDFDRKLAYLLLQKLQAKGYDLNIDLHELATRPDIQLIWSQLMFLAEWVKRELSDNEVVNIRKMGYFKDLQGNGVNVVEKVSRSEYEAEIEGIVDHTVEITDQTIAECGISPKTIDRLLLVGGSSYTPLVQKKLRDRYPWLEQELFEPDLCVALGAALEASSSGRQSQLIQLELPMERETSDLELTFSGRVSDSVAVGTTVSLQRQDAAAPLTTPVDEGHRFFFDNVRLIPQAENTFTISVAGNDDELVYSVRHSDEDAEPESVLIDVPEQIAKPFFVQTVEGLRLLLDEGHPLPCREKVTFKTVGQGRFMTVNLYEGGVHAGRIRVDDLPPNLAEGTPVEVTIQIDKGFGITAEAKIDAGGQAFTGSTKFVSEPLKIESHAEQLAALTQLKAAWDERIQSYPRGQQRGSLTLQEAKWRMELEGHLEAMPPDRVASQRALNRYASFLDTLPPVSHWPAERKEQFDEKVATIQALIEQKKNEGLGDEIDRKGYDRMLDQLTRLGERIWSEARAEKRWHDTMRSLYALERMVRDIGQQREESTGEQKTEPLVLRQIVVREMNQAISTANARGVELVADGSLTQQQVEERSRKFAARGQEIEEKLRAIDLKDSEAARSSIMGIYQSAVEALMMEIDEFCAGGVLLE